MNLPHALLAEVMAMGRDVKWVDSKLSSSLRRYAQIDTTHESVRRAKGIEGYATNEDEPKIHWKVVEKREIVQN